MPITFRQMMENINWEQIKRDFDASLERHLQRWIMDEAKYKRLLERFRHMMTQSGVMPHDVTLAQLKDKIRGDTDEEKFEHLEHLTSMVPEAYWREVDL